MKIILAVVMAAGMYGSGVFAEPAADMAQTTANPGLPIDELALRLKPLTRSELQVEADGWMKLLQDMVREISHAEIGVKYKRVELKKAEEVQEAFEKIEEARQAVKDAPVDKEAARELAEAEQSAKQTLDAANKEVEKLAQDKAVAEIEKAAGQEAAAARDEQLAQGKPPEVKAEKLVDKATSEAQKKVEAYAEEKAESRASLLKYLTGLRAQQTVLVDRVNRVLDALEEKGGDVEEYRQYISAVSGIEVDVSDASAVWSTISGWMLSKEGGLRWLKNISLFVVTVLAFIILSNLIASALEKTLSRTRQASKLLGDFLVATVRRLVVVVGILIGLAALEVNVGPLLAVIGAAGFVIAFALQNSLGNFASGILILAFRPFDVGDVVEIGGVLGEVKSMNLLSVLIHTPDNKAVIISNNQVWGGVITNVTGTDTRRVDLVFGIAYDDDIGKAQRVLEAVVGADDRVLKHPETVIRVHELADSSVNFVCRPWVKTRDYWEVYWALTRAVKERFDQEGISIPFPQRDVHLIGPETNPTSA